jgi:hypothetical protein
MSDITSQPGFGCTVSIFVAFAACWCIDKWSRRRPQEKRSKLLTEGRNGLPPVGEKPEPPPPPPRNDTFSGLRAELARCRIPWRNVAQPIPLADHLPPVPDGGSYHAIVTDSNGDTFEAVFNRDGLTMWCMRVHPHGLVKNATQWQPWPGLTGKREGEK